MVQVLKLKKYKADLSYELLIRVAPFAWKERFSKALSANGSIFCLLKK